MQAVLSQTISDKAFSSNANSNKTIWAGRILSGLAGLFMLTSGVNLMFVLSPEMMANLAKFGYDGSVLTPIGLAAFLGSILYLIPRTGPLGAIVLTGYLGGAVATHVRVHDTVWFAPIIVGTALWLGLWLRDARLRAILPFRRN
jgi:hypothetical protein